MKIKKTFVMELHKRILASIEVHGTIPFTSLRELYPQELVTDINAAITRLVGEGWVKDRKSFMLDGDKIEQRCVSRTKKRMWKQQKLFTGNDDAYYGPVEPGT